MHVFRERNDHFVFKYKCVRLHCPPEKIIKLLWHWPKTKIQNKQFLMIKELDFFYEKLIIIFNYLSIILVNSAFINCLN